MTDSITQLNLTLSIYDRTDNDRAAHFFQDVFAMTAIRPRVALVSINATFWSDEEEEHGNTDSFQGDRRYYDQAEPLTALR